MLPYQTHTIETFLKLLPDGAADILEIGSDIGGEVVSALAQRTGARVVGINPSPEFPKLLAPKQQNTCFLRTDGRSLPFPDNSFDAVLSVATMEHVNGLDVFLAEIARVLKPKAVFFTEFSPIWSSAQGHHVYAVVGAKEARFWKPGKNPIPNYAHLLMSPDEMRDYLHTGPCSEELIEPIIHWIYEGDSINRHHFEDYMEAFRKGPLVIQDMYFGYDYPDSETLARLRVKYGLERNFNYASISGVFRKPPNDAVQSLIFREYITARKMLYEWTGRQVWGIRILIRIFLFPLSLFRKLWRVLFLKKNTRN